MALTPQDVQQKEFRQQFRGYNEVEVDTFLDEVEVELGRLIAENETLRARLAQTAATPPSSSPAEGEEMLRRTLLLAQRTADDTVAAAQAEASRLLEDARTQARETVEKAQSEARVGVDDLDRRRQQLEQHIEGLRAFEREYRTRLKAYLESQLSDLDGRGQQVSPRAAGAQSDGGPAPVGPGAAPPLTEGADTVGTGSPGPAVPTSRPSGSDVPRVAP